MNSLNRWLSVEEIPHHLGVSRDTVYSWISSRQMPAHKIGRLWKFQAPEVDDWVHTGGASDNKSTAQNSSQSAG
ncbi:helix-turn-helix domain-containing protein [Endozoicomonadaceae bacterium StTr2]